MRLRKPFWMVIGAIVIFVIGGVAWWLVSPLFISKTVHEEFPFAATAIVPEDMTRSEVEEVMAGMAKVDAEMTEKMPKAMTTAQTVRVGAFQDADSFHRGSGQATIFRLPDGFHLLRLENFEVTNGPGLHVILTPGPEPEKRDDLKAQGYIDLGRLKGNIGNQNYQIPADVDLTAQTSVVIYCMPFHVVFSVASLEDAA